MPVITPQSTIFFLCDLQSIFRKSIGGFDHLIFTANKLLKIAKILECEVVSCTQAAKALGPLDPGLDYSQLGKLNLGTFDKASFSMITPEVEQILRARPHINNVVLFGIEAHICVLQTAQDLLQPNWRATPYTPYLVADCLSSHNRWEVPVVVDQLRSEGCKITTSESIGFRLLGTAKHPGFKAYSRLVKESLVGTTNAGDAIIDGKGLDSEVEQLVNGVEKTKLTNGVEKPTVNGVTVNGVNGISKEKAFTTEEEDMAARL